MITEDYCSFELSKLLEEKGFHAPDLHGLDSSQGHLWIKVTHQMAMKWLRERHDLHIEVIYNPYYEEYKGCMYKTIGEYNYTEFYSTYEEAVEAAIKYSLEKLI